MLANDNIRLHITADVDDKTGNAIKNIKGNLKEIPAEVTTKIKADGKQAKKEVDDVNKKLEQLNGKNKEIKVTATGTQALNTINSIKKSLSELPKNVSTKIDINAKEAKSQLDSLKKTLNSISKDISTTVKLNHKQADISIEAYKKKLKDITAPIETNTKVRLDTRSALASLNNLNAKLKELKDSDLKLKFSVEGAAAIKALSNGIQSFNKSADAANKKLDKLKNISEILGKIEKNVGINVSINGADETSNRLKEIYGLLKGIRKYSNVKINANANVGGGSPRVQAQPQGSNRSDSNLGSYASQLRGIVAKAEQAHMRGDAQELARLRQEYVLTTQEMLNFQRQFGNGDYNNAIKKLTPIVQTLQRLGIIARDDLGPIKELNNMQFNWDAQMKASTPRTYKQMAQTEKELAEYARQNGNLAESDNHLRNAARLEAEARSINTALEVQRTLQGNIEQTLKEQIKSLEKIAAEQRMQGDTRNLAYTEARLRQLKQEEQLAKARQNPDAYKGLMQEANVYKEQLANQTLTPEARRQLYTQIINTVSNATRQGLRDGMIDNRQAAKNYQKLMPYARELGVENNLQNEITRLGGTTNNAGGQQANNARNEYNDLKRQAVQAIEDINRAWRAGNGTEAEERRLDNILNRMRQIKREAGTLNQSAEANLYTTLANGTQRGSRGYGILTERANQARRNSQELRADTGAGTDRNTPFGSKENIFAYAIRFIGRSSKGTGSAMEAMAQLLKDVQPLQGASGLTGVLARAVPLAVGASTALLGFGAAVASAIQGVQTFSNILIQLGTTIYNALKPGIELYKNQTASTFSFGASLLSNGYDENGNQLGKSLQNKNDIFGTSRELVNRASIDAEMSAFSLDDILKSLQGTLPVLMQKGMSLDQAYDVNKGVAGVSKMLQLAPSQILQETRDLAQGSITARGSQVAGALGVTNEDLAGKSADEIWELLMEKFQNYSEMLNQFEDTAMGRAQQLDERLAMVGKTFVEQLAGGFKSIIEYIIKFTGQYVDKDANGNQTAHLDSISGHWYSDKEGEEGTDLGTDYNPQNAEFNLSEPLQEAADILKQIIIYIADAIDEVIDFVDNTSNLSDPLSTGESIIELIIDGLVICVKFLIGCVDTAISFAKGLEFVVPVCSFIIKLLRSVWAILKTVINLIVTGVKVAILGIDEIISAIPENIRKKMGLNLNIKGDTESLKASIADVSSDINEIATPWESPIARTYKDAYGNLALGNRQSGQYGTLGTLIREGFARGDGVPKSGNGPRMSQVNGNPNPTDKDADKKAKAAQRAADKANREAIRESQKMLKAKQQELKEILEDTLDRLKDLLEKNEVAYKEGFTSLEDYLKQKTELEKEEAEARLKEAYEEKAAIEQSQFQTLYDKEVAIHKNNREIKKYTKQLQKATETQVDVANSIEDFTNTMTMLANTTVQAMNNQLGNAVGATAETTQASGTPYDTGDKLMNAAIAVARGLYKKTGKKANIGYIWGLLADETGRGSSPELQEDNNLGGVTWTGSNGKQGNPRLEGGYYVHYDSLDEGVQGEVDTLAQDIFSGIFDATSADEFFSALKWAKEGYSYMTTDDPAAWATYKSLMNEGANMVASYGMPWEKLTGIENPLQANTQAIQENTQAIQGNSQTINGIQVDTRELGNIVASAPNNPDIEDASDATKLFMQAVGNAWHILHPELGPLEYSSVFRAGDTNSHHGYGEAYDVVNDYFSNKNLRNDYVNLVSSFGGTPLDEWEGEPGHVYAHGNNIHATTPNANYGNGGIFSASVPVQMPGTIQKTKPSSTKESSEGFDLLVKAQQKYEEAIAGYKQYIFGEIPDLHAKFFNEIYEIEKLERNTNKTPRDIELIDALKKQLRQKMNMAIGDWISNEIDFTISHMKNTSDLIVSKLKYGVNGGDKIDIKEMIDKYVGYWTNPINIESYTKLKNKLKEDADKNQELFNGTEINKLNDQIKKLTNDDLKTAKDSSKQAEVDKLIKERDKKVSELPDFIRQYRETYVAYKKLNDEFYPIKVNHEEALKKAAENDKNIAALAKAKENDDGSDEAKKAVDEAQKAWKKSNDELWELNEKDKGFADKEKEYLDARDKLYKLQNSTDMESFLHIKELQKIGIIMDNAKLRPVNWVEAYEKAFIEAQSLGNVEYAEKIKTKLIKLKQELYSILDNFIKTIEDRFSTMQNLFDNLPQVTNLQKEFGDKLLNAYKNQELYEANKKIKEALEQQYITLSARAENNKQTINDLTIKKEFLLEQKKNPNDKDYLDAAKELEKAQTENVMISEDLVNVFAKLSDVVNNMKLNKILAESTDELKELRKTAKQALEDGLVTFLTDGVNEAGSLKEAFGNMILGFLKTMQEFFAKRLVYTLMNRFFNTTTDELSEKPVVRGDREFVDDKGVKYSVNAEWGEKGIQYDKGVVVTPKYDMVNNYQKDLFTDEMTKGWTPEQKAFLTGNKDNPYQFKYTPLEDTVGYKSNYSLDTLKDVMNKKSYQTYYGKDAEIVMSKLHLANDESVKVDENKLKDETNNEITQANTHAIELLTERAESLGEKMDSLRQSMENLLNEKGYGDISPEENREIDDRINNGDVGHAEEYTQEEWDKVNKDVATQNVTAQTVTVAATTSFAQQDLVTSKYDGGIDKIGAELVPVTSAVNANTTQQVETSSQIQQLNQVTQESNNKKQEENNALNENTDAIRENTNDRRSEKEQNQVSNTHTNIGTSNGVGISDYSSTLGMFPQSGFGMFSGYQGSGIGYKLGAQLTSLLQPITRIITSITDQIAGFLNSRVFQQLLGGITSITGSAGAQLAGSVFAIKTLFNGDTKEKLLSMLYLELQLIYLNVSMYLPQIFAYLPQIVAVINSAAMQIQSAIMSSSITSRMPNPSPSVAGHAVGGHITGAGTSTSDSIPAMLSNGEYVIKASSVRRYGLNFMDAVNKGTFSRIPVNIAHFADGGAVDNLAMQETARGMSTFAGRIGTQVSNTTNMSVALVGNKEEAIEHFMKSPRGQKIMLDFNKDTARFTNTVTGRY